MNIALGSDHVGLQLKRAVCRHLEEAGIEFCDMGTLSEERCNYPEFAALVANSVASGAFERGMLFCGTGVGMSIAANKIKGIRSVVCSEPYSAKLSREHNDTNVLCLGSRVVGEDLDKMIVDEWLAAQFEGGRHSLRIQQISELER